MFRLEFSLTLFVVVNQSKACTPSTPKMSPQTEDNNTLVLGLIDRGKLFSEVYLRDRGVELVKNIEDELASTQKAVSEIFARPQCDNRAILSRKGEKHQSGCTNVVG